MDRYDGYYEFIKKELSKYRGSFDEFLFHLPEIFKLMTDLLNTDIPKEDRVKICCALGYFVAPEDVIPESIYGPVGFVDDMFICCHVVKDLLNKHGIDFLNKFWNDDEELDKVLDYSYQMSKKIIEEKNIIEKDILEYVGLE